MPDPIQSTVVQRPSYAATVLAARQAEFGLTQAMIRNIEEAGAAYFKNLDTIIRNLTVGGASPEVLERWRATRRLLEQNLAALHEVTASAIAGGRLASFDSTFALYGRQMEAIAGAAGVPLATLGSVRAVPFSLLGVWESTGSPLSWRTLLAKHQANGAAEVMSIVRRGLFEQVDPEELARRMRLYVNGSQGFEKLFGEVPTLTGTAMKLDLRTLPRHQREAARKMAYNARRIAVTELHQARGEAEIQHALRDPFIKALKRTLSPDRGETTVPDECDTMAGLDFYGMGAGVYPILKAPPASLHPFCRDEYIPVTRPTSEIKKPKPNPRPKVTSVAGVTRLLKAEARRKGSTPLKRALTSRPISKDALARLSEHTIRAVDLGRGKLANVVKAKAAIEAEVAAQVPGGGTAAPPDLITEEQAREAYAAMKQVALDVDESIKGTLAKQDALHDQHRALQEKWFKEYESKARVIRNELDEHVGFIRFNTMERAEIRSRLDGLGPGDLAVRAELEDRLASIERGLARARSKAAPLQEAIDELDPIGLRLGGAVDEVSTQLNIIAEEIRVAREGVVRAQWEKLRIADDWGDPRGPTIRYRSDKSTVDKYRGTWDEGLDGVRDLYHPKWLADETIQVRYTRSGRSFYDPATDHKPPKGLEHYATGKPMTNGVHMGGYARGPVSVVHEFGHQIEDIHDAVLQASVRFLERRTAGEKIVQFAPGEFTKADQFPNSYSGKIYRERIYRNPAGELVSDGRWEATEVLAVGVEHMFTDPVWFAEADFDYFLYCLRVMNGQVP